MLKSKGTRRTFNIELPTSREIKGRQLKLKFIFAFCFYLPASTLKKSLRFLPPVDVAVENALDLHTLAGRLVENQPAVEGRRQDKEAHTFQVPMFKARLQSHPRKLRQPVESLKNGIQKIPCRQLVVGGDEITRGDQVFIRLR
jgi:hypothetical protein